MRRIILILKKKKLAKLSVISSGIYSSIQDLGRYNFTHLGVPISGVLDTYSSQFANLLLGNTATDAVIEITFSGALIKNESKIIHTAIDRLSDVHYNTI